MQFLLLNAKIKLSKKFLRFLYIHCEIWLGTPSYTIRQKFGIEKFESGNLQKLLILNSRPRQFNSNQVYIQSSNQIQRVDGRKINDYLQVFSIRITMNELLKFRLLVTQTDHYQDKLFKTTYLSILICGFLMGILHFQIHFKMDDSSL